MGLYSPIGSLLVYVQLQILIGKWRKETTLVLPDEGSTSDVFEEITLLEKGKHGQGPNTLSGSQSNETKAVAESPDRCSMYAFDAAVDR